MNKDIVFVCTGNTCRSPMAEAIFNSVTGEHTAGSAGIAVSFPQGAAKNSKEAVLRYGTDLDNHTARQLTSEILDEASLIITMTHSQKEMLSQYADHSKLMTLAEFAGEKEDVNDPYGGDIDIYLKTAEKIYDYVLKGLFARADFIIAEPDDAKKISQMEKEIFPDAWSENSVISAIERQSVMVLKSCGVILGYCIFMYAADEGEILRIAVSDKLRRYGLGKKLLICVIEELKKHGCTNVFLEVRSSNLSAISLYKSVGFEEIGVRKNYYKDNGEDAKLFKLEIKER